jgi:hypothetical protein
VISLSQESPHPELQPNREAFLFQLEILKMEIQTIDGIVGRMDEITQTTKNWAVLVWAGGLAAALGSSDLRKYIMLTAVLPLVFWYTDAQWRRLQRRSTFRGAKIREFLNSPALQESFSSSKLVNFVVHDPIGSQHKGSEGYRNWVSMKKTLQYKEIAAFYGFQVAFSLIIGLYFL